MAWTVCAFGEAGPEWEIRFGWSGGYGNDPGIYIKSNGTAGSRTSWREEDITMCSSTVPASDIVRIERKIAAIPTEIPPNSNLTIIDRCYDEREHIVTVVLNGQERSFSYSQHEDCFEGTSIPGWLSELVEELSTHYDEIKYCETDA